MKEDTIKALPCPICDEGQLLRMHFCNHCGAEIGMADDMKCNANKALPNEANVISNGLGTSNGYAITNNDQPVDVQTKTEAPLKITITKLNDGDRWDAVSNKFTSTCTTSRGGPHLALEMALDLAGEKDYVKPKLMWTDQWGCGHEMSLECATKVLKEFYDEWPCGLEEIDACIAMWKRKTNG